MILLTIAVFIVEELNEGCIIMQPQAVGGRVKSLRKQPGITQQELANRIEREFGIRLDLEKTRGSRMLG